MYINIYTERSEEIRISSINDSEERKHRSIFERNLNIPSPFDAQTLYTVIKIQGTMRNVDRITETIGKLVESGRSEHRGTSIRLNRFYSIGIREKRGNIRSRLHVSLGKQIIGESYRSMIEEIRNFRENGMGGKDRFGYGGIV